MAATQISPSWPLIIREACRLWLNLDALESDDRAGNILYAADVSLAFLYADPVRVASDVQMLGLLGNNVLPDLAHVLGHIAIAESRASGGLLLLPGHDREFLDVFRAVKRSFDDVQSKSKRGRSIVEDLATALSENPLAQAKVRELRRLGEIDVDKLALTAASELDILPMYLRTSAFNFARWYDFIARAELKPVRARPDLPIPLTYSKELIGEIEKWDVALRRESSSKSTQNVIDDAEAIAILGAANEALATAGDERRLVLLTTDEGLQTAAWLNPGYLGASSVRDPRAFVRRFPKTLDEFLPSRAALIHSPDSVSYGVSDALRILLTPFAEGGRIDRNYIRTLAVRPHDDAIWPRVAAYFSHHHEIVGRQIDRLKATLREWNSFIRLEVNRYATENLSNDARLATLARLIRESRSEELESALQRYVADTTIDLSVSTLVAGLYVTLNSRGRLRKKPDQQSRMPVALKSRDPDEMRKYHQFVDDAVAQKNLNSIEPFLDPDQKYRVHLHYGVYLAAIGDWEATETVARAALGFADARRLRALDRPGLTPDDTGEEAAYLLAVAARHRTTQLQHLDDVSRHLAELKQRVRYRLPTAEDPRWELESVALEIKRAFWVLLLDSVPNSTGSLPRELADLRILLRRLDDAGRGLEREEIASKGGDTTYFSILKKQRLGNILVLGMLEFLTPAQAGLERSILTSEAFRMAVRNLDAVLNKLSAGNSLEKSTVSQYTRLLVAFGHFVLTPRDKKRREVLLKLIGNAARNPETPYDAERYRRLTEAIIAENNGDD